MPTKVSVSVRVSVRARQPAEAAGEDVCQQRLGTDGVVRPKVLIKGQGRVGQGWGTHQG